MATTYDDLDDLDAQNERALTTIRRQRSWTRVLVLVALGSALLVLLGSTYAMYARDTAPAPAPYRTGTSNAP
jgi:hypothetical protein